MEKIIDLKNISKYYHTLKNEIEAIDDISFSVYKGDFISIVGPSGCGKSTLLSILSGIDNKSSGEIIFNKDLKFGYMMQLDSLLPWKNVFDNALLGLKIRNECNNDNIKLVNTLLEKYGLSEFKNKYPNSLSGGMRQRVALIRTLALSPDILLLDEPFSALDYQTKLKLNDYIYKVTKENNITVIMVTHDLNDAISLSNKVIVLSKRPSKINKVIDIDLERILPSKRRRLDGYNELYDEIWNDIDDE